MGCRSSRCSGLPSLVRHPSGLFASNMPRTDSGANHRMHLAACIDMRVFRCSDTFGVRAAPGLNGCHGLQGLALLPSPAVVDRARAQGWIWRDQQQDLQVEAAGADAEEPVAKRAKR